MGDPPTSAAAPSSGVLARRHDLGIVSAITQQLSLYYSRAKSFVYDVMILRMTEKWYRAVLNRLDDGTLLLDVGIGTGGALLRCQDLIEAKNLKVVGIDIDAAYVEAGRASVEQAGLSDRISLNKVDVYEGWLDQPGASASSTSGAEGGCPPVVTGWAGRGSLLVPVPRSCEDEGPAKKKARSGGSHSHVHDDGQHHNHDLRPEVEQAAVDREAEHATRVDKDGAFAALHSATVDLLVKKGAVTRDELRRQRQRLWYASIYGECGAAPTPPAPAEDAVSTGVLPDSDDAFAGLGSSRVSGCGSSFERLASSFCFPVGPALAPT